MTRYKTNSTELGVRKINNLKKNARQITRTTFLKYVQTESLHKIESILGYDPPRSQGIPMAADETVTYYRSTFEGRDCFYFDRDDEQFIFC